MRKDTMTKPIQHRDNYHVAVTETRSAHGFTTVAEAEAWVARKCKAGEAWVIVDRHGRIMKGKA